MQFEKDLLSFYAPLFKALRERLLSVEGITELKKDRITTYHYKGSALCHLRTVKDGVDIGFLRGAFFTDKFKRLQGQQKRLRVITLTRFEKDMLDYYLQQALTQN